MSDARAVPRPSPAFGVLLALLAAGLLAALYWIFAVAPVEARMGLIQKIFYFHVPAAVAMYACFITCGVASLLFLLRRSMRWDALAVSGAEAGVLFGMMVLLTGPLWARGTWGTWWVWDDPQLTTTLLLFLIYMTYLFLRRFLGDQPGARRLPAVLAAIGMLDIPIIHYSVRLWRGQHPQVVRGDGGGLAPEMMQAFLLAAATFLLLAALLVWLRLRLQLMRQRLDELSLDLLEREGRPERVAAPLQAGIPARLAGPLATLGLVTVLVLGGPVAPAAAEGPPAGDSQAAATTVPIAPSLAAAVQPAAPAPPAVAAPTPPAVAEPTPPAVAEPTPPAVAEPTPPAAAAQPAAAVGAASSGPPAAPAPPPAPARTPGERLMVLAYAIIWLLVVLFLLYLWRRTRLLELELREMEAEVRRQHRD